MTNAAARYSDLPIRPIITIHSRALQAPPGVAADLAHARQRVERAVADRQATDTKLINYWLYFWLLSWTTLGVYTIVLAVRRINRIDRFSARKSAYYQGLIDWTDRYAQQGGSDGDLHHRLTELRAQVNAAYAGPLRRLNAGLSVPLAIMTFGIFGLYVRYRENRYWWDAERLEREFDDRLWAVWAGLGIARYPITFCPTRRAPRSFRRYLILTIVTAGLWGILWSRRIHSDPELLYRDCHPVEDSVLQVIRTH
jgi:hypothetical protein